MLVVIKTRCCDCRNETYLAVSGSKGILVQGATCAKCGKAKDGLNVEIRPHSLSAGVYAKAPRGRPRIKAGEVMSRATLYRRRKEQRA